MPHIEISGLSLNGTEVSSVKANFQLMSTFVFKFKLDDVRCNNGKMISKVHRKAMEVSISDDLKPILRVGVLRCQEIGKPTADGEIFYKAMSAACQIVREQNVGLTSGQVPGVDEARRLYKSVGLDPTKTRPSSEALLRRVLKGQDLYRIHPLVDLFNLASLSILLPVGLYDESKIVGEKVTVKIGEPDWEFDGIRKAKVHVGGRLCVGDEAGPFGSPTSDSLRTSIEEETSRALAIFFAPAGGKPERLQRALELAAMLAETHLSASIMAQYVL
jgi:DNA/RNA-binding domain of Phe-tRNA-synthetase-like protein